MLVLQRTSGGGTRIAQQTGRTEMARRQASMLGATGITQRGRAGESRPGEGLSFGGILSGIGGVVGGFLTGGPMGAVGGLVNAFTGGAPAAPACPPGFVLKDGKCQRSGVIGTLQTILPGGATGFLPEGPQQQQVGNAVVGAFGLPALTPRQVGTLTRDDGVAVPLLRCVAGFVLGKDNLCYPRVVLGRRGRFRKHPAAQRAPVTAEDAKCIRRAESARKRVKTLAGAVGFTCAAKGARRGK